MPFQGLVLNKRLELVKGLSVVCSAKRPEKRAGKKNGGSGPIGKEVAETPTVKLVAEHS